MRHYTDVRASEREVHKSGMLARLQPEYQPYCESCGWLGLARPNKRDAQHDADEHVLAMAQVEDEER